MRDKPARKHHFLPQFYLAGFSASSSKDDFLWVFDQTEVKQWRARPADIAHQRDFYRVDLPGVDPDAIEQAFSIFETRAAPVVKKIVDTRNLPSGEEFVVLLNLIAWIAVKIPGLRTSLGKFIEDVAKKTMGLVVATPKRWEATLGRMREQGYELGHNVNYEDMRAFVESDEFRVEMARNWYIRVVLNMMDAILPYLAARRWSLVIAEPDTGYFTCSDRPVALIWTTEMPAFYSAGFGMRNTQLTFPLSKEVGLIGEFDGEPTRNTVDRRRVAGFNSRTGIYAERFVYSTFQNFYWLRKDGEIGETADLLSLLNNRRQGESI